VTTFLSVISALVMGLVLVVSPWTTFWEVNHLLHIHPLLRAIMLNPYLRGAVSGLGLVNLVVAALEVHAHLRSTGGRIAS
jgi:hypothetical protein